MKRKPAKRLPRTVYKLLRDETKLSQSDLARLLGIDCGELKNIERGKSPLRMPVAFRYHLATGVHRYRFAEAGELHFSEGCKENADWQAKVACLSNNVAGFENAVRWFLDATLKKTKSDPKSASLYPLLLAELMLCLARFRDKTQLNRSGKKGKRPESKTAKWCSPKGFDCPDWTHQILDGTSFEKIISGFREERLIRQSEMPSSLVPPAILTAAPGARPGDRPTGSTSGDQASEADDFLGRFAAALLKAPR